MTDETLIEPVDVAPVEAAAPIIEETAPVAAEPEVVAEVAPEPEPVAVVVAPTVPEAEAMFDENPGLASVHTVDGILHRDGVLQRMAIGE